MSWVSKRTRPNSMQSNIEYIGFMSWLSKDDSKWLLIKYTISVVVMLKKHAGYSSFYFIVGGKEDKYFLFKFSLYTHPDISFKINEWSTKINESEEFLVIFDEPYYIRFGPFSNSVPSRSVHTKYTIIVTTVMEYVEVIEVVPVVIHQCKVKIDISYSNPLVTFNILWLVGYWFQFHFDLHTGYVRQCCLNIITPLVVFTLLLSRVKWGVIK